MTDLPSMLADSIPGVLTDAVGKELVRVLVPAPRGMHEYVTVIVEPVTDGWLLSDAGEVQVVAGGDIEALAHLMSCAGAEIEVADGTVTWPVASDDPLPATVMSFAQHLMTAPALWRARTCLAEEESTSILLSPESAAKLMAKATRERLVQRLGRAAAPLIGLDRRVQGRGESVRAPLAIMPPASRNPPLLVAAFLDTSASERSVTAAKKVATWTFEVVHEYRIPKYIVIRGASQDIDHFASFYDNFNVTAVPIDDGSQLVADAVHAVERLGFAPK